MKVLIVDDSQIERRILREMLMKFVANISIEEVSAGEEAVMMVMQDRFYLWILL